jgi:cold shock CspA family protein
VRVHGTLTKWNDQRGFGFIARDQRDEELFVHISAFPRDGIRPRIGERLSFEVVAARPGTAAKPGLQAVAIQRTNALRSRSEPRRGSQRAARRHASERRSLALVLALGCIVTVAIWSSADFRTARMAVDSLASPEAAARGVESATTTDISFACDGRTRCSQMTSCAEATWFLRHCPNVQMDGDHDGLPCEQQWCSQ